MDTQWLDTTGHKLEAAGQKIIAGLAPLAAPQRVRQIKTALCVALGFWLLWSLAGLLWQLLPQPAPVVATAVLVNPLQAPPGRASAVDIEQLTTWELFGNAVGATAAEVAPAAARELGGIEDKAGATRLKLLLRGALASSDPQRARAIIESEKQQQQYAVGEQLPVSGQVTLAKILAQQVVLNNGGSYELLRLFEPADGLATARPAAASAAASAAVQQQPLSDIMQIVAVREAGQLRGYRVSAGRDREQFARLGFQPNDLVTGVNGIALTDPGKAMELYRVIRTAEEASFNVRRGAEQLTLVVGPGHAADNP